MVYVTRVLCILSLACTVAGVSLRSASLQRAASALAATTAGGDMPSVSAEDTLKVLDLDGSGMVTFDEVKAFAEKQGLDPKQTVLEFRELDLNHDGKLGPLEILKTIGETDEAMAAPAPISAKPASPSVAPSVVAASAPLAPLNPVPVAAPLPAAVASAPVAAAAPLAAPPPLPVIAAMPANPAPAAPEAIAVTAAPALASPAGIAVSATPPTAALVPSPSAAIVVTMAPALATPTNAAAVAVPGPAESANAVAAAVVAPLLAATAEASSSEALPMAEASGALLAATVRPEMSVVSTPGPSLSTQLVREQAVPAPAAPASLAGSQNFALRGAQQTKLSTSASEEQQAMTQATNIAQATSIVAGQFAALTKKVVAERQQDQYQALQLDTYAKELRINATKLTESTPLIAQKAAQAAALVEITKSRQQVSLLEKQAHEAEEEAARLRADASAAIERALKAKESMVDMVQGLAADAINNITATYSKIQ